MSLILDRVSYHYPGTKQGLEEVSINVQTGELVAVIGPSGSGKSTLLKLVSGLTTGHSGSIVLDGDDLSNKPVHHRNIGMVFQNYALFPHLNVENNIAYGLKLRNVPAPERLAQARDLLALVGLADYGARPISKLSGGQQQRVALARALAINPKALLLDEPLAALDAGIRGHLRDQIRAIQRRFNATTLLVTHDQEEALSIADRVAVLKDGKLLQLDTPARIYEEPATRAVAEFVGLSTILPVVVAGKDLIDAGCGRLHAPTGGRRIGSQAFALMRPEHFRPDPGPDAVNRIMGKVGARRYLGSVSRYDFHVEGLPKTLLGESKVPAVEAVAISPEHIRLLDD